MLPETNSSRSLASMIDQIGSGSRYTGIVNRREELIFFPDANQAMEARTSILYRAARNENWDPLTVALLLSTGPISEGLRVELLSIATTNVGGKVDTEIARLLLANGPISEKLIKQALRGTSKIAAMVAADTSIKEAFEYAAQYAEIISLLSERILA